MANQPTKLLAVRVPEAERRRIKSLAAIQGLTLQEAVHQAMEAWALKLQAEGVLPFEAPSSQATANLKKPKRRGRVGKRA